MFDSDDCNVVHQVSFRLGRLEELRQIAKRIIEKTQIDINQLDQMDHGNAWSLYFKDPEENMLELYVETPWNLDHPFAFSFDIMQPDDVIMAMTYERVRDAQGTDPWLSKKEESMRNA